MNMTIDPPQEIAPDFKELALVKLSVKQNGAASIESVYDRSGKLTGYRSAYPIDLSAYKEDADDSTSAPFPTGVPVSISRRQFAQALAKDGTIEKDEALAFVRSGALPKALQDVVDATTDKDEAFDAEMMLSGATMFERAHPMVETLGKALGKSDADLDALWTAAGAL